MCLSKDTAKKHKLNFVTKILNSSLFYFEQAIIFIKEERDMEGNNKPVVNLISKPDNMLKTVYTACRTCYSADNRTQKSQDILGSRGGPEIKCG